MENQGHKVNPSQELLALMDGLACADQVRTAFDGLSDEAREVINLWASCTEDERKAYAEWLKDYRNR